jgi:hypothetical protein
MKLEQRAVSGVWIGREDGVRQVGTQQVGVSNRNHLVIDSIDYECGMTDPLQVCEALTDNMHPLSKCRRLTPRALSVSYAATVPTSGPAVLLLHPRKDVARPPKRGQFSISCLGIAASYGTLRGLVGDYGFSRSALQLNDRTLRVPRTDRSSTIAGRTEQLRGGPKRSSSTSYRGIGEHAFRALDRSHVRFLPRRPCRLGGEHRLYAGTILLREEQEVVSKSAADPRAIR